MEKTIAEIDIDLKSEEACKALMAIQRDLMVIEEESEDATNALEKMSKKGVSALAKLNAAFMMLRRTITFVSELFTGIVNKVKYLALAGLGTMLGAAMGTNREATEGAKVGLSWNGSRALQAAADLVGFRPNLEGLQEQLAEGQFNGDFVAMGLDPRKLQNKDPVSAFNEVFNKFAEKLDEQTKMAGGDKMKGLQMFKAIYGDMLQNLTGMGVAEFNNIRKSGVLGRFNQAYGEASQIYGGINAKELMAGEKALWKFWETLKAIALQLTAEFAPGLTKLLNALSKGLRDLRSNAECVRLLKAVSDAFKDITQILINLGPIIKDLAIALTELLNVSLKILKRLTEDTGKAYQWIKDTANKVTEAYQNQGLGEASVVLGEQMGLQTERAKEAKIAEYEDKIKKGTITAQEMSFYDQRKNPEKYKNINISTGTFWKEDLPNAWKAATGFFKDIFGDSEEAGIKGVVAGQVDVNITLDGQRLRTVTAPVAGPAELSRNPGVK